MGDQPGVLFKDGPYGRRARQAYGPDVGTNKVPREVDERGPAALDRCAEVFALTPAG